MGIGSERNSKMLAMRDKLNNRVYLGEEEMPNFYLGEEHSNILFVQK